MSIQTKIKKFSPWFHNIHLPGGQQTAPHHLLGDFPAFTWHKIRTVLPETFDGFRILDVGCNAGFYSIELAKMGADIVAIHMDEHYLNQGQWVANGFELESKIEFRQLQ